MKLSRRIDINRAARWFTSLLMWTEVKKFSYFPGVGGHSNEQTISSKQSLKHDRRSNNYRAKISTTICLAMWKMMFEDHFGCFHVKTISTWRTSETKRGKRKKGTFRTSALRPIRNGGRKKSNNLMASLPTLSI